MKEETLAEETHLSDDLLRRLIAVGEADILVGIPTLNDAETVGQVVRAVQTGLVKYFPRERSVLINPDGGSTDGTLEAVRDASIQDFRSLHTAQPLRTLHRITASYPGRHGREGALRTLFTAAELLRAKACAVVGADLQSITPEWIESLVRPIYKESLDLVTPLYHRHKFDGLLINNILYPMVRAVYGRRIREPLGGEFAFSGRLMKHYLSARHPAGLSPHRFDLWMTASAIKEGFRIGQSFLGPRLHAPHEGEVSLAGLLEEVVGGLFGCMEEHASYWLPLAGSEPVPRFGFEYALRLEPVRSNRKRMLQVFRSGVEEFASILEKILTPETLHAVRESARRPDRECRYPDPLWVKTLYEFAAAYHHAVLNRSHLVRALTPLYLGRTASFVQENAEAESDQVERRIEALCVEYERSKPYLIERWNSQK